MNSGDGIQTNRAAWSFGGNTVQNFDNHIEKSVPGYLEGHELILKLSDYFVSDGSYIYDIGCSTGTLLEKLINRHELRKNLHFIGIDNIQDMISEAKKRLTKVKTNHQISAECSTLGEADIEDADLILSYYTVQFMKPKIRQEMLNKIYRALNWGGAFIMFEKVRAPDARFQDIMSQIYNDYKSEVGYSAEEIYSKALSLKGILEPFSSKANIEMLKRSGFNDIMTIQKSVCFEGFLAIK